MVYLYTGTPGSGKSYHCAREIHERMQWGKTTIGNFSIDVWNGITTAKGYRDYKRIRAPYDVTGERIPANKLRGLQRVKRAGRYYHVANNHLTPKFLYAFARKFHRRRKEHQTTVYIDEASLFFNSRTFQSKDRMQWIEFLQLHRHFGFDVVLITQHDRMIDRQIRSLADYEIQHRDVKNYRAMGYVLSLLFGGHLFLAVKVYYGFREKIGQEFMLFNRRIANLYDTFSHF